VTSFLRYVVRALAGCALLFLTVICMATIAQIPLAFDEHSIVIPLACGFAGGLVFFTFVNRLPFLYVCGHELTHWIAAKFFLRETGRLEINGTGGHVQVERPNVWIVLAPYFVPVYSVVWTGIYGVVLMCWSGAPAWVTVAFNAGLGITYAFHVRMTVYALSRAQTDLRMHGFFLSISLILCFNALLVLGCLIVASGQWGRGGGLFWDNLTTYGTGIIRMLTGLIQSAADLVNG